MRLNQIFMIRKRLIDVFFGEIENKPFYKYRENHSLHIKTSVKHMLLGGILKKVWKKLIESLSS